MTNKELNDLATAHWIYTKNIIVKASHYQWTDKELDLMGYLYTEAFKHGWKHKEEDDV